MRGAKGVREPWEESDENGSVVFATIQTVRVGVIERGTEKFSRPDLWWLCEI